MTSVQQDQDKGGPPPDNQPPPYGQQQATTHVIVAQPQGVTFGPTGFQYGPSPITMTCPHCNVNVTTNTEKVRGMLVWYMVGIICLVGLGIPLLWLGCCFIPFCIPAFKDTIHSCPNCQKEIARHPAGGMR